MLFAGNCCASRGCVYIRGLHSNRMMQACAIPSAKSGHTTGMVMKITDSRAEVASNTIRRHQN